MRYTYSFKEQMIVGTHFDLSGGVHYDATCIVRNNEGIGRNSRPIGDPKQVVYAMDGDRYNRRAYMPQRFPRGIWEIGQPYPIAENDPEYSYKGPWIIPTNAFRMVQVWDIDEISGGYLSPTDEWVKDWGYAIHYSESRTTLGCLAMIHEPELMEMKTRVEEEKLLGQKIFLEVI